VKDPIPEDLDSLLREAGARVIGSREIAYGTQYRLQLGSQAAVLNVFSTGKVTVQGKTSELKDLVEEWKSTWEGASVLRPIERAPRLGIDEAGKGDYFGPLVVAGARIPEAEAARELAATGVRDSKLLRRDERVRELSGRLLGTLGAENVDVISLLPPEYEDRRKRSGNSNRLLAELDAEIIHRLAVEVEVIVVDEFARDTRARLEPVVPSGVRLEVRPRAEDDVAVAAASVLARARFLEDLEALSARVGFALPKGATHVLEAGRRVFREQGRAGLDEVAKTSFRTTELIVGGET
jgi:ribonuclease HIII